MGHWLDVFGRACGGRFALRAVWLGNSVWLRYWCVCGTVWGLPRRRRVALWGRPPGAGYAPTMQGCAWICGCGCRTGVHYGNDAGAMMPPEDMHGSCKAVHGYALCWASIHAPHLMCRAGYSTHQPRRVPTARPPARRTGTPTGWSTHRQHHEPAGQAHQLLRTACAHHRPDTPAQRGTHSPSGRPRTSPLTEDHRTRPLVPVQHHGHHHEEQAAPPEGSRTTSVTHRTPVLVHADTPGTQTRSMTSPPSTAPIQTGSLPAQPHVPAHAPGHHSPQAPIGQSRTGSPCATGPLTTQPGHLTHPSPPSALTTTRATPSAATTGDTPRTTRPTRADNTPPDTPPTPRPTPRQPRRHRPEQREAPQRRALRQGGGGAS